jgi:hypothetical protein
VGNCGLDASGSGQEPIVSSSEHGKEPMAHIKSRNFLLTSFSRTPNGTAKKKCGTISY